ncbi:hypothetical protein HZH66_000752 [Vespula vulgaris]|uniref:Uncharacterized protein n=1 Tax=Vespula vulgaris TaxID=7454 RepID=A0A834KXF1_VESVU|nr:hypothetical protein HZH66_000752 [Vespula vulgaris]
MGLAWNVKSSEGEGLYRCYSEEPTEYPFTLGAELVFETDRKIHVGENLLLYATWLPHKTQPDVWIDFTRSCSGNGNGSSNDDEDGMVVAETTTRTDDKDDG